MLPDVAISTSAWHRVTGELERVAPREGLAVPLVSLRLRDPDQNPCVTISLLDIEQVVIADVILVPSRCQQNAAARVSVIADTDQIVNPQVEARVARAPRLRACAYLHSHPFAVGRTWPSRGPRCDYEGHMLPLLQSNCAAGLGTSLSFIACRGVNAWRLQAFALDGRRDIADLGFATVIHDDDPLIADALRSPLHEQPEVRATLRHFRRQLRRRRLRFRCDELFDGWQRMIIELGGAREERAALVALVPIDFPERPPQFYFVERRTGRSTRVNLTAENARSTRAWLRLVDRVGHSGCGPAGARPPYHESLQEVCHGQA